MMIDSHLHLDDSAFDVDREEVIKRGIEKGVSFMVNVGTDLKTSIFSVKLAEKYDRIFASVGIHPHEVSEAKEEDLETLIEMTSHPKVLAWGEIGLDFYREISPPRLQREWFIKQLHIVERLGIPAIIHCRNAYKEVLEIIKEEAEDIKGVFHCFSGTKEDARKVLDMGFSISISGAVTFHNARKLLEVAGYVPLDRLMVETDSPYLAPEPFRGKRNEPMFLGYIVKRIAEIRGMDFEEVSKATSENAISFYGIEIR
jgi:TatD DNase family protein